MLADIYHYLDQQYDFLVQTRRYLHQYPELSFQEKETAQYIARFYEELGTEVQTGVGGNGVVARIKGGKPGKTSLYGRISMPCRFTIKRPFPTAQRCRG